MSDKGGTERVTYSLPLPEALQADALRLLEGSRLSVNSALTELWPRLSEFGPSKEPAWKLVEARRIQQSKQPSLHARCEAEAVGNILRTQAERKMAFDRVLPLLGQNLLEESNRGLRKNKQAIRLALKSLGKDAAKGLSSRSLLKDLVYEACDFFLAGGRFPSSFSELQPLPLLQEGLLSYPQLEGREKDQAYRLRVSPKKSAVQFQLGSPDNEQRWQWHAWTSLTLPKDEITRLSQANFLSPQLRAEPDKHGNLKAWFDLSAEVPEALTLVEQHRIGREDPRFAEIDAKSFAAKNLFNAANYAIRQAYFGKDGKGKRYIPYVEMAREFKSHEAFKAMNSSAAAQQVLQELDQAWQSYFAALQAYKADPSAFKARPKPPGYKDKKAGRCLVTYTSVAINTKALKQGLIGVVGMEMRIKTKQGSPREVRIVPRKGYYVVEVAYKRAPKKLTYEKGLYAGADPGVNNTVAVASNQQEFISRVVKGGPLKCINQRYNMELARLQSLLPEGQHTSHRIQLLADKRNRRVNHYLHIVSKEIITILVKARIGVLVVGKNEGWKQECEMGKVNNQNFQQIPLARLIDMLTYKGKLVGIEVITTEEAYTSKCSFLDLEELCHHEEYKGRRVKRGLFRASDGTTINADVQGAANTIRKVAPEAFTPEGVEGLRGSPVRGMMPLRKHRQGRRTRGGNGRIPWQRREQWRGPSSMSTLLQSALAA